MKASPFWMLTKLPWRKHLQSKKLLHNYIMLINKQKPVVSDWLICSPTFEA
jgi:hypothetical protein